MPSPTEVVVPCTERSRWVDIAAALNAAHDAGMPVGIDLDGTLTDRRAWSVVWDRSTERWTVAGYEDQTDTDIEEKDTPASSQPAGAASTARASATPERRTANHAEIAQELTARPYVWGTVSTYPAAYVVAQIARRIREASDTYSVYGPAGSFETRATPVEDGTLLEARYVRGIARPLNGLIQGTPDTQPVPAGPGQVWPDAVPVLSSPTGPNGTPMTPPPALPHDPYITAVVDALTAAGLEPSQWRTSDAESNRYDTSGLTRQLDAVLEWDGDAPALNTEAHEDGITLVWEHPAEQWQWAPRKQHGELEHEPEFLVELPRWIAPTAFVVIVRLLLSGRPTPGFSLAGPLWKDHGQAQAAVDAWAAQE